MKYLPVSVIIPTYNRRTFLKEALKSVLEQDGLPREIIVVDDGSTDGTLDSLNHFSSPLIRVIRQDNQGPAVARNRGVAMANSPWIAFLDSDDFWLPKKLLSQIEFLKQHSEYKICQTEEVWFRRGVRVNPRVKHKKHSGHIFEKCLKLCIISPSAVVIEKDFFEKLGGFDPRFPVCEDYELWLRASLRTPIMTLPEALTVKRGGYADQLSKKYWGMDRFRVQALEKILVLESLTPGQRQAIAIELAVKLSILKKGFLKHHPGEQNPYQERLQWLEEKQTVALMGEGPMN